MTCADVEAPAVETSAVGAPAYGELSDSSNPETSKIENLFDKERNGGVVDCISRHDIQNPGVLVRRVFECFKTRPSVIKHVFNLSPMSNFEEPYNEAEQHAP